MSVILDKLKYFYRTYIKYLIKYSYYKRISYKIASQIKPKNNVFLFLTPSHGNMGDHAITIAEIQYIKNVLPNSNIVEILEEDTFTHIPCLQRIIKKEDLVLLHGGGNMGDLYIHEERARRYVIDSFRNNRIISFPQSVFFTDSKKGRTEMKITRRKYGNHKQLTLVARDKVSYGMMTSLFTNQVILTPDIVLFMDEYTINDDRNGILLCIRNDKESILNKPIVEDQIKVLREKQFSVKMIDTDINKKVMPEQRETELQNLMKLFRTAEIVITDRLHGMIFSVITGTPCIVMNNSNGKVIAEYDWLKNIKYIKTVQEFSIENISLEIDRLINCNLADKDKLSFTNLFLPLEQEFHRIN